MSTKIVAARLATSAGVTTVITRSSTPSNITNIIAHAQAHNALRSSSGSINGDYAFSNDSSSTTSPDLLPSPGANGITRSVSDLNINANLPPPPLHTRFLPSLTPIHDRSFWLLHGLAPHGTIYIDEGAHLALMEHAGLLPVGVVDVEGAFAQQEAIRIVVVRRHKYID